MTFNLKHVFMCFLLFCWVFFFTSEMTIKPVWVWSETLIRPTSQPVQLRRGTLIQRYTGKTRKVLVCFPAGIKNESLFRVLLTLATSLQQSLMHAHTCTHTHEICVRHKGTSWFRVRPGRRGAQGHGNGRTPEGRRAQLSREVEGRGLKLKLKQTQQGHRRPQGHGASPTSFTWVPGFC